VDGKARAAARQSGEGWVGGSLHEEDGDLVFVNGKKEQSRRLAVEVGKVCAFEDGIWWKSGGVGKIEAEGKTALEPGFDGVTVTGDDLWGGCAGKGGEVLVEEFGRKDIGLMKLTPTKE
jgi:hypothetical protein